MRLLRRLRRRRLWRCAADSAEAWQFEPCLDCGAAWYQHHDLLCPAARRPHP